MAETIYISKISGKGYIADEAGRIDTRFPVDRNLTGFRLADENALYSVYTNGKENPMLTGSSALQFYKLMTTGGTPLERMNRQIQPDAQRRGYFKAVKHWVSFDNTGPEWREETHAEVALCILWLNESK